MDNILVVIIVLACVVTTVVGPDIMTTIKMGKTNWGSLSDQVFCPTGVHVVGFRLRVHDMQGIWKDDSGMNGIQLKCRNGETTPKVTGPDGSWRSFVTCSGNMYVTGFNFRSEQSQGAGDDAAGVDVKMQCNDRKQELDGDGLNWGSWEVSGFQECPSHSYFCGVQARIEHAHIIDSTGVNEVIFICCHVTNGGWSSWSNWSACNSSCSTGIRTRTRHCNNPTPMPEGSQCMSGGTRKRFEQVTESCEGPPCPVNGEWNGWNPWTVCSVSCSTGTRKRTRHCDNPPPAHGGLQCMLGDGRRKKMENETMSCSGPPCPVKKMPAAQRLQNNDGSASFVVHLIMLDGNIRHYDVIVMELGQKTVFPRTKPQSYSNDEIKRNVEGLYVAGRIYDSDMFGKTFIVGKTYVGNNHRQRRSLAEPRNKRLKEDTNYGYFIRGYVTDNDYASSPWYPPIKTGVKLKAISSPAWKVIVVVIVVIVVLFVIIVFLYGRRKRRKEVRKTSGRQRTTEMDNRGYTPEDIPTDVSAHGSHYDTPQNTQNVQSVNVPNERNIYARVEPNNYQVIQFGGPSTIGTYQIPMTRPGRYDVPTIGPGNEGVIECDIIPRARPSSKKGPPIYNEITPLEDRKPPEAPPAYEDIPGIYDNNNTFQTSSNPFTRDIYDGHLPIPSAMTSDNPLYGSDSTPYNPLYGSYSSPIVVYKTEQNPVYAELDIVKLPQPLNSPKEGYDKLATDPKGNPFNTETGYKELTNRAPNPIPLNEPKPGYDMLNNQSNANSTPAANEAVYAEINVEKKNQPLNQPLPGYDALKIAPDGSNSYEETSTTTDDRISSEKERVRVMSLNPFASSLYEECHPSPQTNCADVPGPIYDSLPATRNVSEPLNEVAMGDSSEYVEPYKER